MHSMVYFKYHTVFYVVGDGGAGVRWTPLLEVSTDRGGSRDSRRPFLNNKEEMLEVSKIYSSIGMIDSKKGIIDKRPFRSPHHTSTKQSMIGGGSEE